MSSTSKDYSVLHLSFLAALALITLLESVAFCMLFELVVGFPNTLHILVLLFMRLAISIFIAFTIKQHMDGKLGFGIHIVFYSFLAALYRSQSYAQLSVSEAPVEKLLDASLFFNLFFFMASFAFVLSTKSPKDKPVFAVPVMGAVPNSVVEPRREL